MTTDLRDEVIFILYKGERLNIKWIPKPPPIKSPAMSMCLINSDLLLLLTEDRCLYEGRFSHECLTVSFILVRTDVKDLQYNTALQKMFLVTGTGNVFSQHIHISEDFRHDVWEAIIFDPLELSEEGVVIDRMCCSSESVLFTTLSGEIYIIDNCSDFPNKSVQPKLVRIFNKPFKILDIAANDSFFVLLVQHKEGTINSLHTYDGDVANNKNDHEIKYEEDKSIFCSNCEESQLFEEHNIEINAQNLIRKGFITLHTEVYTFCLINKDLLEAENHTKRDVISIEKLKNVGVSSITTSKEKGFAYTIDGRLYYWSLNLQKPMDDGKILIYSGSPTESHVEHSGTQFKVCDILGNNCRNFQRILNLYGKLSEHEQICCSSHKDFVMVRRSDSCTQSYQLIFADENITLYNRKDLKQEYYEYYNILRNNLEMMLNARKKLTELDNLTNHKLLLKLNHIWHYWQNIIYLFVALVSSFEEFYQNDCENPSNLDSIKYYRECIKIFEIFTKAYCDIYSIDGFKDAGDIITQCISSKDSHRQYDEELICLFQQPLQTVSYFVKLLEQIHRKQLLYSEELFAWEDFSRQYRINLELADNTRDFWRCNTRNMKLMKFKSKYRRVILTSTAVPLKCTNSIGLSTSTFILFSDCFCQVSNQLYVFPLIAMWIKIEDAGISVVTPEKNFMLVARSYHEKVIWYDQLESSIKSALLISQMEKLPNIRNIHYTYGQHCAIYSGVEVYGSFCNGIMHGKCYLKYPSGIFYFGEICHGVIEGYGRMILPKIGVYKGNFRSGKFCGYGILVTNDKELYDGHFRNGYFEGHGFYQHNDIVYIGEFKYNVKSGYGVLDNRSTGEKYMGLFFNNHRAGAGICITSNGNYFEGVFANDELNGKGIAIFGNNYYYEGELTIDGPNGEGKYYMPAEKIEEKGRAGIYEFEVTGNVLCGQLGGSWNNVRIISGTIALNTQFWQYPKEFGKLNVSCDNRWRALFNDFEEEVFGSLSKASANPQNVSNYWSCVDVFIKNQCGYETENPLDLNVHNTSPSICKNSNPCSDFVARFNKLMQNPPNTMSGVNNENDFKIHNILDANLLTSNKKMAWHYGGEKLKINFDSGYEENNSISIKNISDETSNTQGNLSSATERADISFVPQFGLTSLNGQDLICIKNYLTDAFRYRHHPLFLLNQRIVNSFYMSYGCWKMRPCPLLAKQAVYEWESISERVYKIIRKLFPALPEEYCVIEKTHEIVSHITLLYPILLSEGIYSTLFVLYADIYSHKDEVYRKNLVFAEKLSDLELAICIDLESSILPVVHNDKFLGALETLKFLKEKYSPMDMLTVIENCIEQIASAYRITENESKSLITADVIMSLTLFLLLRSAVPHLGAELALLDELVGTKNVLFEMSGMKGYCYTTLKGAYEHLATKSLQNN